MHICKQIVSEGALAISLSPVLSLNYLRQADQLVSDYWRELNKEKEKRWRGRAHFKFECVKQHIDH